MNVVVAIHPFEYNHTYNYYSDHNSTVNDDNQDPGIKMV